MSGAQERAMNGFPTTNGAACSRVIYHTFQHFCRALFEPGTGVRIRHQRMLYHNLPDCVFRRILFFATRNGHYTDNRRTNTETYRQAR